MSELRQRKDTSVGLEASKLQGSTPIQSLKPDVAIPIDYQVGNPKDKKQLEALLDQLYAAGFFTQIRPLSANGGLLVFARLGQAKFNELKQKDEMINYEYDVSGGEFSNETRHGLVSEYLKPILCKFKNVKPFVAIRDTTGGISVGENSNNAIARRYGTQVLLYFEFVRFYLIWLASLSVLGLIAYFSVKHKFSMLYTILNLLWGLIFLVSWKKFETKLVKNCGTKNVSKLKQQVPEFDKPASIDVSRYLKQLCFIPVALIFAAILIAFQLGCFVLEIFLSEIYDGPWKIFIAPTPTMMLLVFVPIFTVVYNLVSEAYTNWENHASETSKHTSTLIKNWVLNFLTSYNPLLITSFVYLPFAHLIKPHLIDIENSISSTFRKDSYLHYYLTQVKRQEDFEFNQERLNAQFYYFIVTNQVVQLLIKSSLLLISRYFTDLYNKYAFGKETTFKGDFESEAEFLNEIRRQIYLPPYNVDDDFRGYVLQFGYLIIFGPVWSLAPLFSLVFASINYFLDLKKLECKRYYREIVPQRVDSIYPWNHALFILTWIGSVVGPAITAFYRHGTRPPRTIGQLALDKAAVHSKSHQLFMILFFTEHMFLICWFALQKMSGLSTKEDTEILLRRKIYETTQSKIDTTQANEADQINEADPWAEFTIESALSDAEWRSSMGNNHSSVASLPSKSVESVKEATDSTVNINGQISTIDDNNHIQPEEEEDQKQELELESNSKIEPEARTELKPETRTELESATGTELESATGTELESETRTESESEPIKNDIKDETPSENSNTSSSYDKVVEEAEAIGSKIDQEAETRAEVLANTANAKAESFVEGTKEKAEETTEKLTKKRSTIKKMFAKKK